MLLLGLVAAACLPSVPAAVASSRPAASPYPAGAQRPTKVARASELAHKASAGGTSPGGRTPVATAPAGTRSATKKPAKHAPKKPKLPVNAERAQLAFEAMQKTYYIDGSGLYQGEPFSFLWPFSQALAATMSVANIPSLKSVFAHEVYARLVGLKSYLDLNNSGAPEGTYTSTLAAYDGTVAPPAGPGGAKYYDDNAWVGIELARMYELTHVAARARRRRGDHGVRDGRLGRSAGDRLPGRHPVLQLAGRHRTQHRHQRAHGRARLAAVQTDRQRPVPAVRRDGLRMGAQLPDASQTACTPTTSAYTARSNRRSGATTRAR